MTVSAKNFSHPDEVREFPNGHGDVVDVGGVSVGRGTLRPGWRWSNDVKALAGTTSCEIEHTGFLLAGQLHIEMDDGHVLDLAEGDVYAIPAGHDAWVVGDDACITLDWSGNAPEFARPRS